MEDTITLEAWLTELAAKQPTPGGGAVAALSAATAAALIGMVSIYTTGDKWVDRSQQMQAIHAKAAVLRQQALDLMAADAAAFASVGAAYKLPKLTDAERATRQTAIQAALAAAAEPPCQTTELARQLLPLASELLGQGNPNVLSDVAVAASNVRASLEAAIVNIQINQRLLDDATAKAVLQQVIDSAQIAIGQADNLVGAVSKRLAS